MQFSPARIILIAKGLRSFGDGFVALRLPLYLTQLNFSSLQIGFLTTATLFGSAAITLGVGAMAHRIDQRRILLGACLLMFATDSALACFKISGRSCWWKDSSSTVVGGCAHGAARRRRWRLFVLGGDRTARWVQGDCSEMRAAVRRDLAGLQSNTRPRFQRPAIFASGTSSNCVTNAMAP